MSLSLTPLQKTVELSDSESEFELNSENDSLFSGIKIPFDEIVHHLNDVISTKNFFPIVFCPKYRSIANTIYKEVKNGEIESFKLFGAGKSYFGYYKHSNSKIYHFEIYEKYIYVSENC